MKPRSFALESLERRLLLSGDFVWGNAAGGSFNVASNWVGGLLPTANSNITIGALNPNATVNFSGNLTLANVTISSNGALVIDSGALSVSSTVTVAADSSLTVKGHVVSANGDGASHTFDATFILQPNATLTIGGGSVKVTHATDNFGYEAVGTLTIDEGAIVDAKSGSLEVASGNVLDFGEATIHASAQLKVDGGGLFLVDSAGVLDTAGLAGNATTLADNGSIVVSGGGTAGFADLSAADQATVNAGGEDSSLTLNGASTFSGQSSLNLADQASLTLADTATLTLHENAMINNGGGALEIDGTLSGDGSSGYAQVDGEVMFGFSDATGPPVDFGSTFAVYGGEVMGSGKITAQTINLAGTISPGGDDDIGSLSFSSANTISVPPEMALNFNFQVGPTGADLVNFTSTNSLPGTIDLGTATVNISYLDGFSPDPSFVGTTDQLVSLTSIAVGTDAANLPDYGLFGRVNTVFGDATHPGLDPLTFPDASLSVRAAVPDTGHTFTYTGPDGDSVSTPENWSGHQLPTFGSNIVIPVGIEAVIHSGVYEAFNNITVLGTLTSQTQHSSIELFGSASTANILHFGQSDAGAFLTIVSGAQLTLNGSAAFSSDHGLLVDGTLTLANHATLSDAGLFRPAVMIAGDGTLAGTGTFDGDADIFGTIAPGTDSATGTLAFNGDLTLEPGAALVIKITSATQGDKVSVDGDVTLNDTAVTFQMPDSNATSYSVNFLVASNINGEFGPLAFSTPQAPGYAPVVTVGFDGVTTNAAFSLDTSAGGGGGSGESTLSTTLRAGLPDLQTLVRQIGAFFNLNAINYSAQNTHQPDLAVLPASLDSLFGISGTLASATIPTVSAATDNATLASELITAGFTVDAITGGATVGSTVIPDVAAGSGLLIQVHYTATLLANIPMSGSYSGATLNADTPNLLQGLASNLSLTGAINWAASLSASLTFGVDSSGFFVSPSSVLVLAAAGAGTVSGSGKIGGQANISLSGTAGANLSVALELGAQATPYRSGDLNGTLANHLVALVSGTANLNLNATVGPLSLAYSGAYTQTSNLGNRTQSVTLNGTVTGTLSLPGVTTAGGAAAAIQVGGTYNSGSNSWNLTASASDLRAFGLTVTDASLNIALSAQAFTGSGSLDLQVGFLSALTAPVSMSFQATFDAAHATFTADVFPEDVTVANNQGGTLLTATNVHLTATLTADFAAHTFGGLLQLTAGGGTFNAFTVGDDPNTVAPALTLQYDFASQLLNFAFDQLTVVMSDVVSISVSGVVGGYDRTSSDPHQVIATVAHVKVNLDFLTAGNSNGPPTPPSITADTLTLTQSGFTVSDAAVDVSSLTLHSSLVLSQVHLDLSQFGYDASAGGFHGTVDLSVQDAGIFPNSAAVGADLGAITGSYTFPNGNTAGSLTLTVPTLTLHLGDAVQVSASNITLTPNGPHLATIAHATASSTLITNLGTAAVDNLVIDVSGFSVADLTLGVGAGGQPAGTVSALGQFLSLTDAALAVHNFSFNTTTGFSGSVALSVGAAALYPAAGSALTSSLTGVSGRADFSGSNPAGHLGLSVDQLSLTVAGVLTISAGQVALTPSDNILATIGAATVSSSALSGLGTATLTNFELTRTGFTIGSATLATASGATAEFGRVLALRDASISVTNLAYDSSANHPFSGTMTLGFGSAALFPAATAFLTTTLQNVNASFDLSGSSPTGDLRFDIGTFTLQVGDAFIVTASNVTLTPAHSTMATIGSATISSPTLAGLPTASLAQLVITQDGFSLADFTLHQADNTTVTIGSALNVTGANLSVTNFAYSAGNAGDPVTGTVTLTLSGASLFSHQSVFTTTLTGLTAGFDFSGATPHGALSISVASFTLGVGEALQVTASNVAITPSAPTLVTIATATVSSPTITHLASATINNLAITATGFSLGSFTLAQAPNTSARIGSVLALTGASLVVSNFAYDSTNAASPISGTIALTVGSASLYPDASAFSTTLGNLVATYLLGGSDPTGRLSISVGSFALTLGEALRITASDLTLTPGAATIATIASGTITSPLITGLTSAGIANFVFTQTGFSVEGFELDAAQANSPARIGDFLALTDARLQVSNFSYDSTNAAHPIAGTATLSFGGVQLYPDSTAFTTTLTGATASFDLAGTATLQIAATAFELRIGDAIDITAHSIAMAPGQATLFTLASATVSSPQFTDFGSGTVTNLAFTRTGFTLGSFTFGQSGGQTVNFGSVLRLTGATFSATNFAVTYGGGSTSFSGAIGLSATSVSLYPASALFTTTVSDFTMNYALGGGGDGALHIHAGSFTLQVGEALAVSATDVEIAPGSATMFTLAHATIASPQFADFGTGTIDNLVFTQTGFSLGSFSFGQSGGQTVNFGTVLQLTGAQVTATDFAVMYGAGGSTVSGTLGLSAQGVSLFPNSTLFTTTVADFTTTYDFSPGGDGALHIHAGTFTLQIGQALQVTASDVTIAPGSATMFTLAHATVSSPQFADFGTGTIDNLAVTQTGFSLGSFSLGQSGGQTVNFGTFLQLTGATFTATNFAVTYGTTTTVSGTIGLSATRVALYPGSTLFTTTVGNFSVNYDFSPSGHGALVIHADTFTLAIGEAIQVSATDVTIAPGSATMFTLANATVSSPQFSAFTGTVSNLAFQQTGFTLGSFSLSQPGGQTVNFGNVLQLTGASFTATNFSVTYGAGGTTVNGTIGLAAQGVSLFPNSTLFTTTVGDFTMDYALGAGGDGNLHIHAGTFALRIGEALQVSATDVEIEPGQATMFTVAHASVSSPQFADFGSGTIDNLAVTQTGFTLGSFTLGQSSGQTVNFGSFLRLTGAKFSATNFAVTYGATTSVSGTIGLSADGLQLFPGSSFLTTTVTGLAASYDYSAAGRGALSIHVDTFDLKIGDALAVSTGALTITPGQATILTIASATVGSPSLTGFQAGSIANFTVQQTGFSLGHFTLSPLGNAPVDFGNFLELTGAALVVDNFALSVTAGTTTITGTIGLSATGVTLFPGESVFTVTLGGVTITYDLGSNAGTGALQVNVASFALQFSDALVLTASNVAITPGQNTLLTIGTASLSSPAISGLGASVSNFVMTRTGFTLGSVNLAPLPNLDVKFGDILTFTGINFGVTNLAYDHSHLALTGGITIGATSVLLFPGSGTFTASASNITGGYTLGASGFGALSLSLGGFTLQLGSFLTFTGSNIVLTPEADTVLTVGSIGATVAVGSITIGGTAQNFAITKTGDFKALTGFGVGLDLNTDSGKFQWPSWLPIQITQLALTWRDINTAPLDFAITLSASVTGLHGLPVNVSGSVSGLTIDLGELSRGHFPIIDLGSASITIDGNLFGGQVSGSIVLGIVKVDAQGNQIQSGDTTTPVAQRILYGGIRASLSLAGISGFSIEIGISDLGPLSIYVSAGIPILLDPNSGLSITNFYAGVVFDTSLPSITDPKALRGSAFQPANQLTDAQWVAQLEASVLNQARAPPGDSWNVFSQPMLIEGGLTLFSAYTSPLVFHADVSVIISTDGKFLVSGSLVFGDSLTLKGSIYADLSAVRSGQATFLFLIDAPAEAPVLSIYGGVIFNYVRNDHQTVDASHPADTFTIHFEGGLDFSAGGLVTASMTGSVDLAFGSNRFDLALDGRVSLPLLGDALGVAGAFHLTTDNGVKFWGALVVQPNFNALTQLGLTATGIAILRVNSTTDAHTETLNVPGQANPETYDLPVQSVGVFLQGTVAFALHGSDWFNVSGTWDITITPTRLTVLATGTFNVGPAAAPFLVYNYHGFFQIDASGVAAALDVTQTANLPAGYGVSMNVTWQITLNTTSHDVTFTLPQGAQPIDGQTSFTITGAPATGPPGTPPVAAAPYLSLIASGDLTLLDSFTLHGTFYFLLSPSVLSLTASATLRLHAGNATILGFNVSGGLRIDGTGAVAVLQLGLDASIPIPANLGLSISGSFELDLNTTGVQQTVGSTVLEAGDYVRIVAYNATLLEFGVSLTGSFTFTAGVVNGLPTLNIAADATLKLFVGGASGGLTLFSFTVKGGLLIDTDGIAAYIGLSVASGLAAGGTLGYQFAIGAALEINTTGKSHSFTTASGTVTLTEGANNSHTPGAYAEVDLNGALTVAGLVLTGDFFVSIDATTLTIFASATAKLQIGGASGATLFTFGVQGAMVITPNGVAGYLTLQVAGDSTSSIAGYQFAVSASVMLNTTGNTVMIGSTSLSGTAQGAASAGAYAQVDLHGTLVVSGLTLTGDFYASVSSNSLVLYASAKFTLLTAGLTGPSLFTFNVSGGMVINTGGLAAYLTVSGSTGLTSPITFGYSFTATATVLLNTTRTDVVIGGTTVLGTPQGITPGPGTATPYAQVDLHGSLIVSGLTLTGDFYVSISSTSLVIYATASATLKTASFLGSNVITVAINGGMAISSKGIAAFLTAATAGSVNSAAGLDFLFNVSASVTLNTTGGDVAIGATTVSGTAMGATAAGSYAQVDLHGSLTVNGLKLTGDFYVSVSATSPSIYADATLALQVGGATDSATLLTFAVTGAMLINNTGLAAYLSVAAGTSATSTIANYTFAVSATVQINTTGTQHTFGSFPTVQAGAAGAPAGSTASYAQVDLNGKLTVGNLSLSGDFFVSVSSSSLQIYASATLALQVGGLTGATLLSFAVTGGMQVNSSGLAAFLSLSTTGSLTSLIANYKFNATATIYLNTTRTTVTLGGTTINAKAFGAPALGLAAPYAQVDLDGSLTVGGLTITGDFYLSVTSSSLSIYADATLALNAATVNVFTLGVTGAMRIDSTGLASALVVTVSGGAPTGLGFTFAVSAVLEINTTNADQSFTLPGSNGAKSTTDVLEAGVYGRVAFSGTLTARNLVLTGDFTVTMSSTSLSIVADATLKLMAGSVAVFTLGVNGAMTIYSDGLVALLSVDVSGGAPNGLGFSFNVSAKLEINTTSRTQFFATFNPTTHQLISTSIPAGPYAEVIFSGTLTVAGFTLVNGTFTITAQGSGSSATLNVSATATLGLTAGSTTVLSLNVDGAMTITSAGIYALIDVAVNAGVPSSLGFSFNASASLQINTTPTKQSFAFFNNNRLTVINIPAGPYAQVVLSGTLTFSNLTLTGTFTLTAGNVNGVATIEVDAHATFSLAAGSATILNLTADGAMRITSTGLAAWITLGFGSAVTGLGFAFNVTATLEVNTTRAAQTINGNTLAAGPYGIVDLYGTLTVSGFVLYGDLTVGVSLANGLPQLDLTVTGSLDVYAGSTKVLSFTTSGFARIISGSGIAVALTLTLTAGVPPILGFALASQTTFALQLNTTTAAQTFGFRTPTGLFIPVATVSAGPFAYLSISGAITIGGFSLSGTFNVTVKPTSLLVTIQATASIPVFAATGSMSGTFSIFSNGLVLNLSLDLLSINTSAFSFSGSFSFKVNTTNSGLAGVAANTIMVEVDGVSLKLLGFTFTGSISIGYTGGVFTISVPSSSPLTLNVYSLFNVSVSGYLKSDGSYSLTGSAAIGSPGSSTLGNLNTAGLKGSFSVTIDKAHGFSASFSGDLWLFGTDVGAVSIVTQLSATPFTYTASEYHYYNFWTNPVQYAQYPNGQRVDYTFANTYFVISAYGSVTIPGVNLTVTGTVTMAVGAYGLSGLANISGSLFGLTASARLYFNAQTGSWNVTASASDSLGGTFAGFGGTVAFSVSATLSSDWTQDSLSLSGTATLSAVFTVSASLSGTGSLNGSFSLTATFDPPVGPNFSETFAINLATGAISWGSDLSGGYAFLDLTGNGVWDASMPRVPVDANGSFNFDIGNPSQWVVDSVHGYAFQDLNGNGAWDDVTEAYVPLKADGTLPDAIARLLDPSVDLLAGATDAASVLGLLQPFATIDANGQRTGVLDISVGHVRATGGHLFNADGSAGAANTAVIDLGAITTGYTGLTGPGQTVFFDTNGNGVLDAGEISVPVSAAGYFTFAPDLPQHRPLGLLAAFDRNGNGVIDANEGSIVVTGARDKNNGLVSTAIIRMAASELDGLASTASPLAALRAALVNLGATAAQANARLAYAFGIRSGIDFGSFVPSTPGVAAADRDAVLRAASQMETLLHNAAALLSAAAHGTLAAAAAQQVAFDELARTLMGTGFNPPTDGATPVRAALDLTDAAFVNAFFARAAAAAPVTVDAATLDAAARITAALNLAAAAYAATGDDPTRELARIDALVQLDVDTTLAGLVTGNVTTAAALAANTGDNLATQLNSLHLLPVSAPTVATPADVSVQTGAVIPAVFLDISSATTLLNHLTVRATSSNPALLPDAGLSVKFLNGEYVLFLQAAANATGTSLVTVTVTDGSLVTTVSFHLTVANLPLTAPTFTTTPLGTAQVGQNYAYGINVTSSDANRTFTLTTAQPLPAWLTLTDHGDGSAVLAGTPGADVLGGGNLALVPITLVATDDRGGVTTQVFTLAVTAPATDAILLTGDTAHSANVGGFFNLNFSATADATAGALTFSTPGSLPAWLTLTDHGDGTASLSGTPGIGDAGDVAFTLAVTDANGQVAAQGVTFAVTASQLINRVPDLTMPGALTPGGSARLIGLILTGADANSQLIVSSSNPSLINNAGLLLTGTGNNRALTLQPLALASGRATITLTLLENGVATASTQFQLIVTPVINPTIGPVDNVAMPENSSGSFTFTITGVDGNATLTVASGNPALIDTTGLTLGGSGGTRTLTLRPQTEQTGRAVITLTLTDDGLVTTKTFQLTVTPIDHPVTLLSPLPAFVVATGTGAITVDLSRYFSNLDGTTTYALGRNSDPALLGARIDGHQLILTPAAARAGLATLDIVASSVGAGTGQVTTATGTIHLTVLPDVTLSGPAYLRLANGAIVARFTVSLNVPSNQPVRVAYATTDGTARQGIDYLAAQGFVDLPADSLSVTIDIGIPGTTLYPGLDFTLALNSALSALLSAQTDAQVAIPVDRIALFNASQGAATVGFGIVVSFLTNVGAAGTGQAAAADYPAFLAHLLGGAESHFGGAFVGFDRDAGVARDPLIFATGLASLGTPHTMRGYRRP